MRLLAVGLAACASGTAADARWSTAPPLPTARHGLAAATVGGKIYVIGGGPRAGFAQTAVVEVFTP